MIPLERKESGFGIDGDTTIISYMLMGSTGQIEQGSLSAIRISNQCHIDDTTLSLGQFRHAFIGQLLVFSQ